MATGLNPSDVVRVSVTIEPLAAQERNFGAGNIVGSSGVIDTAERKRVYTTLEAVLADFGTATPEGQAAQLYFAQDPQPALVYVSRWAQGDSRGVLHGGPLSAAERALSNFTGITNGSLKISVDGSDRTITGLNFSSASNLNAVADIVQTALAALAPGALVQWNSVYNRFDVATGTRGTTGTIGYGTNHSAGTAVAPLLKLTAALASPPVNGIPAESLADCLALLADMGNEDYAYLPVSSTDLTDQQWLDAAAVVEGLAYSHLLGITTTNPNVLDRTVAGSLASQLEDRGYKRTFLQFSSSQRYAVASMFGRASTVDFDAADTTLTLKFKQEPGVVAETITASQAATLKDRNCNVFVNYANDTAILQHGTMVNGYWFDEVHGLDWLQNDIQTGCYNLQYTTPTKVPQDDAGTELIKSVIKESCFRAVSNGLLGGGVWTGPKIGPIKTGDVLPSGFFIYAPPVATQSKADRASRRSVSIQVLAKLKGAVHDIIIAVYANR